MDVRDRLRLLKECSEDIPSQARKKPKHIIPIHEVVDGFYKKTPYGPSFVSQTIFPLDPIYGPQKPCYSEIGVPISWISKDENLHSMDLRTSVFLDTETTGLAGGTGTWIILVGVGYLEGDFFKVEQFFLRDYDEELAFLYSLSSLLEQFRSLVTFNGKAFDVPLLETRLHLAVRDSKGGLKKTSLSQLPHLDLLHCGRRLWKNRLKDCSLDSLESNILGIYREDDVPGTLIPSLYFQYLQNGDARSLEGVFRHNLQDVVSLLSLALKMCHIVWNPKEAGVKEPTDLYSLAKLYEDLELYDRAIYFYEAILKESSSYIRWDAMRRLSFLYKRLGRMDEAVALWQTRISEGGDLLIYPYLELAKYYEHEVRDYERAKEFTEDAIDIARRMRELSVNMEELEYRRERLTKKIAKEG